MVECWMACWRHHKGDCFFAPEPAHCRKVGLCLLERMHESVVRTKGEAEE